MDWNIAKHRITGLLDSSFKKNSGTSRPRHWELSVSAYHATDYACNQLPSNGQFTSCQIANTGKHLPFLHNRSWLHCAQRSFFQKVCFALHLPGYSSGTHWNLQLHQIGLRSSSSSTLDRPTWKRKLYTIWKQKKFRWSQQRIRATSPAM